MRARPWRVVHRASIPSVFLAFCFRSKSQVGQVRFAAAAEAAEAAVI